MGEGQTYLTETSGHVERRAAEPVVLGDDLVGRRLGPRDSGDKILRLIVDQADHGPHAVKAPQHELGVGIKGAVVEDRPVDAMALDGIRAAIEGRKEPRRQEVSSFSSFSSGSSGQGVLVSAGQLLSQFQGLL